MGADMDVEKRDDEGRPMARRVKYSSLDQMKEIRVLNLSRSEITSLPKWVSEMPNLKAIVLYRCTRLKRIPPLSALKELQLLDLSHTAVEELPQGLEDLSGLRRLCLSYTTRLKVFRAGVLPRLAALEELSMHESRWVWSRCPKGGEGASVEEIAALPRLAHLELQLADWPDLVACLGGRHRRGLKKFLVTVGFWCPTRIGAYNSMVISGCDLTASSLAVLDNTLQLIVQNCQVQDLSALQRLRYLKECYVKGCNQLEWLGVVEDEHQQPVLPNVEKLEVSRLRDLLFLFKGFRVGVGSFAKLKILTVRHCGKLVSLFSVGVLERLSSLEKMVVTDCYVMEELFAGGEEEEGKIVLPQLKSLVLRIMSELKSVCRGKLVCPLLESIEVDGCPQLKKLPLCDEGPRSEVRVIYSCKKWLDELEWDQPHSNIVLHPLNEEEEEEGEVC